MNFLWREDLHSQILHIADSKVAVGNFELEANALAALFAISPENGIVADKFAMQVLGILSLLELKHDSQYLPPLIDSWIAHPSDYLNYRESLAAVLAELKKRSLSRGKGSSFDDLVEIMLQFIDNSDDSIAADLSCVFTRSLQNLPYQAPESKDRAQECHFSQEILENRIARASAPVSKCLMLILMAQLYEMKRQYEMIPPLVRQSLLAARKIESGEVQRWRKTKAYGSICKIVELLPDSNPEKVKLGIEIYDDLKPVNLYRIGEYDLACLLKAFSGAKKIEPYMGTLDSLIEVAKHRSVVPKLLSDALICAAETRLERKDYECVKYFLVKLKECEEYLDLDGKRKYAQLLKNCQSLVRIE
ncbi:MAG: hypothetical protein K2X27_22720 [Candidatus Obscuribacterales bacterium]|nr:hypothetical protein [Candidatus Obscuribacterales bacterium]